MNMKRQDAKNLESSLAVKLERILEGVAWLSAVDVVVKVEQLLPS
jgi:hypothetical protein